MPEQEQERIAIYLSYYRELLKDQKKLRKLEAAGVDNWEWYEDALESDDYIEEDEGD